ncbi:MAG: porin [Vulcanimicrobiota bacterium]
MFLILFLLLSLAVLAEADEDRYPDIVVEGQVQLQFEDGELGALRAGARPARNGLSGFPARDVLRVRRLRLIPTVHLAPNWALVNETDFEADQLDFDETQLTMLDLYVRHRFDDQHHLRIGQFKVPFGWEFFRSSRALDTIERSDVSRVLFQRDIGLGGFGQTERWEYGVAVVGGQGQNVADRNGGKDLAARLVYSLSPSLRVGASGHLGTIVPEGSDITQPVQRYGLEAHFEEGPWKLEGELILGDGYNLFSRADSRWRGYYLTGVYRASEEVDAVVSFDQFDPDLDRVDLQRARDATNARSRVVLGVNYYLSRKPVHRFQLNYEFRQADEGAPAASRGLRARYQYAW